MAKTAHRTNDFYSVYPSAAATPEQRRFIERTYGHLAAAVGALVSIETAAFSLLDLDQVAQAMSGVWWASLLGLVVVTALITGWVKETSSKAAQYLGLASYTGAVAFALVPVIWVANQAAPEGEIVKTAAVVTLAVFAALTAYVFKTRVDFAFAHGVLVVASVSAISLICTSLVFGFSLGALFAVCLIALSAAYIVYYTSVLVHTSRVDQHVVAALGLFASIVTMFLDVLRLSQLR